VPRGLGDEGARGVDPRPDHEPGVDVSSQRECRSAHVADGREAIEQVPLGDQHRAIRQIVRVHVLLDGVEVSIDHHVRMAVDQSRHHRAAPAVDDRGAWRLDLPARDRLDQIALDQDVHFAGEIVCLPVENVHVRDEDLSFARSIGCLDRNVDGCHQHKREHQQEY
jgi:hypothetical protein